MWKHVGIEKSPYFYKYRESVGNKYAVFVTDYINIWFIYMSQEEFIEILKKSNFLLEGITEQELIENGKKMLTNGNYIKSIKQTEDDQILVNLIGSFGYPFKLNIQCNRGSSDLFFCEVTQSLLRTINDLHSSQRELSKLLKDKNAAIDDYISEHGKIRFHNNHIYNEEEHMTKYSMYSHNFGPSGIPTTLLEKEDLKIEENEKDIIKPELEISNIKQEIKHEPDVAVKTEQQTESSANEITNNFKEESVTIKQEILRPGVLPKKRPRRKFVI